MNASLDALFSITREAAALTPTTYRGEDGHFYTVPPKHTKRRGWHYDYSSATHAENCPVHH